MVPGMYQVESYLRVRRAVMVEGMTIREASPGVRAAPGHGAQDAGLLGAAGLPAADYAPAPPAGALHGVIDRILGSDWASPGKQSHTAKRIFERLRDEYGFEGQHTIVKDYVQECRRQTQDAASEPDTGDYGVILLTGRSDSVFLDELTAVVEGFPCLGKERCECLPDVGHVRPRLPG